MPLEKYIVYYSLHTLKVYSLVSVKQLSQECFLRRGTRSRTICDKYHMLHYLIGLLYISRRCPQEKQPHPPWTLPNSHVTLSLRLLFLHAFTHHSSFFAHP